MEAPAAFGGKTKIERVLSFPCCSGIKDISEPSKTNIFPTLTSPNSVKCSLTDVISRKGC